MNTRRSGGQPNVSYAAAAGPSKALTPELYATNAKICRLVKLHPIMYDRSNPLYLKKDHMESAWEEIAREMNDSITSCKERWRNIRTSFARSINKNRHVRNRIKPYYLNDELQFLRMHITPGVPIPNRGRGSVNKSRLSSDEDHENDENDNDNDNDEDDVADDIKCSVSIKRSLSAASSSRQSLEEDEEYEHILAEPDLPQEPAVSLQMPTLVRGLQVKSSVLELTPPVCPCPPKKRQRTATESTELPEDQSPLNISANTAAAEAATIDFDDAFLKSLRPEMNHMNFNQKLHFKRRVYELLGEIFPNSDQNYAMQSFKDSPLAALDASPLQHLGLVARTATLQLPALPKNLPKTSN